MKNENFGDIVARGEVPLPAPSAISAAPVRAGRAENLLPPDVGDDSGFADKTEYAANGVGSRRLRELLRKSPEADLDLHGLTAAEAHSALDNFLRAQVAAGRRNVEIIHGRGEHSADGRAVLRTKTRKWLAGCDAVLGFCEPRRNSGAVRVLLRKI